MDGQFVPNKTFDHTKIKELRQLTLIPFDAHLMIDEPVKHVHDYVDAGSDIITVHAEVCDESSFGEICDVLHSNEVGIGLAINPDTETATMVLQICRITRPSNYHVCGSRANLVRNS